MAPSKCSKTRVECKSYCGADQKLGTMVGEVSFFYFLGVLSVNVHSVWLAWCVENEINLCGNKNNVSQSVTGVKIAVLAYVSGIRVLVDIKNLSLTKQPLHFVNTKKSICKSKRGGQFTEYFGRGQILRWRVWECRSGSRQVQGLIAPLRLRRLRSGGRARLGETRGLSRQLRSAARGGR